MESIHPSIHWSSPAYPGLGCGGREAQTSLSPVTLFSSSGGIPRCSQSSRETKSLHHVLGLPGGLLLEGSALNTPPGVHPGGILTRCLNHPGDFSTWRNSKSTLSSSRDEKASHTISKDENSHPMEETEMLHRSACQPTIPFFPPL